MISNIGDLILLKNRKYPGTSMRDARSVIFVIALLFLGGCASTETIRGRLSYDLRPDTHRPMIAFPASLDLPRYRYAGELIGEPNFEDISDKKPSTVINILKWIAGVFEQNKQLLLQRPQHGTVSDSGRIYVVDAGRNAVMVFDPNAPQEEKSERGEGQLLMWEFATTQTRFMGPVAVTTVWGSDIAVSDAILGLVVRLNDKGEPVGTIGAGQLQRPTGVAFDPARGLLFVADRVAHNIKVFDAAGQMVNTFGEPGDRPGQLNAPTHLSFSHGHLYVSDTLNNRIQVFDGDGRWARSFGEQGLNIGNLTRPKGVAAGNAGIVYVVESYFGYLLAFNEKGEFLLGINGSGLRNGEFMLPSGVWADKSGRVFVADMFNGRVVVFQFLGGDEE